MKNDPRYHNNTPYNPASMYRNCVNSPLRYEQVADESGDDNEANADNEKADDTEES